MHLIPTNKIRGLKLHSTLSDLGTAYGGSEEPLRLEQACFGGPANAGSQSLTSATRYLPYDT